SRRPASRRSSGGRNRPATVCVRASAAERKAPWKGPFGGLFHAWESVSNGRPHTRRW
ncbi:23S rRNA pseudouridylate synthase B, partial [Pseudomonas aeruginosa]